VNLDALLELGQGRRVENTTWLERIRANLGEGDLGPGLLFVAVVALSRKKRTESAAESTFERHDA